MVQPRGDPRRLEAQQCRADIAEDMTAREIAEAQRAARAFLSATAPQRAPPKAPFQYDEFQVARLRQPKRGSSSGNGRRSPVSA